MHCWPTPLQWLCGAALYWQKLKHAAVNVDPEHPEHAPRMPCLVRPMWNLVPKFLGCANQLLHQLSGWLVVVQEEAKFSKTTLKLEMNTQFTVVSGHNTTTCSL